MSRKKSSSGKIKIPDDPFVKLILELNDIYNPEWRIKFEKKMRELKRNGVSRSRQRHKKSV
jgi:hypothetical protein